MGGLWQALFVICGAAIVVGALVVGLLLLYYRIRGCPALRCPWCGENLSQNVAVETAGAILQRWRCENSGCDLKEIIVKTNDGRSKGESNVS